VRTFEGHKHSVTSVSISPDGRWGLSASNDETLRLWELATGECMRTFKGHKGSLCSVSISPDGRWALSGSYDKTLRLWALATGRCVRVFEGHTDSVESVAFSSDGRWALSGSSDETLRLWELATGRCVRTFEGHEGFVASVAFSPDGRWVLSGSWDNTLQLWELDWECEFPAPADWDEGARPYLESFLSLHTPYAAELPRDHTPSEEEIRLALTHVGKPSWNEQEFDALIRQLQYAGYGWLRPDGVRKQLEEMVKK
jgi:WD40 repeat protein